MQYQFAEPFIVDSSKIERPPCGSDADRAGLGRDTRHLRSKDSTSSALTLPLVPVRHSAHAASMSHRCGYDSEWLPAQKALATLSTNSRQRVVADATHASLVLGEN